VRDDQTAEIQPVQLRRTVGDESIIEPGAIERGMIVITDGHLRVKPGAKVQIKPGPASGPATSTSKPVLQARATDP
jgi:hypothetical protein